MKNLISGKLSFIIEGETKIFPDGGKLREGVATRFALQEMPKSSLQGELKEH